MPGQYKQLLGLLCISVVALIGAARLFDDFLHARRFVQYGIEKQATILELDHMIGGKSPQYVYSLRIDQSIVFKTFPYNWTLPIKRSFLVMPNGPAPDNIALGNQKSSAIVVLCYMEGCDRPDNRLIYPLVFLMFAIGVPFFWIRLIRNWEIS
ncbi:MAG TPA: hypothetical protein VK727_04460 [Steroidobacteraceae bacterium]|jgi:hypothetical protein|nr:hypothetical protein [Steroidobacteraceae bacterium]